VPFASFRAFPKQIAEAEEIVIGTLAKASGIATAASQAVSLSGERMKIVSGAWKKMPPPLKGMVRRAVCTGGAHFRICEPPMLYLDKNYICMFGSVERTLQGAEQLPGLRRVVQIRGKLASIAEETRQAVCGGGDILMVDTGSRQDLHDCQRQLRQMGCRMQVQIAFAGDVHLRDIPELRCEDIDILGIGKDIVDAPLLDMRLDVVEEVCV
jgi:nicotinate-nucleotide pyrophosphorylase (carboxylating)